MLIGRVFHPHERVLPALHLWVLELGFYNEDLAFDRSAVARCILVSATSNPVSNSRQRNSV